MRYNIKKIITVLMLMIILTGCATIFLSREQKKVLGELLEILDTSIVEAEDKYKLKPDPTSPMKDFVETLTDRREYISQVEKGKIPYDADLVSKYFDEIKGIVTNIRYPVGRILEADVFFKLGEYKISGLSVKGKEILNNFAKDVIDILVKNQRRVFPRKKLSVIIRTIGYADEITPRAGLAEVLTKNAENFPEEPDMKKIFLNKKLSRLRAEAINDYIRQQLKINLKDSNVIIGPPHIIGLGEELPYPEDMISPPYKPKDARRRICKIHGNVFISD
ncbi:MAG: hypothetical protein GY749_09340 [Desulfobacteraceae bacterium]|nr:hypothetical protein [Desulfobacteraceae bacterium]